MKPPTHKSRPDTDRFKPGFDHRLTLSRKAIDLRGAGDDEQFEVRFMESLIERDPCNEEALMLLGHAYTRMGDLRKGLDIDRRLVRLRPADPTAYYNLACSCSLLEMLDDAFAALERAAALGYRDVDYMSTDPDLANARRDGRFQRLIECMRRERAERS